MYYIRFSADEFIKNVSPNLKLNLPWLIQKTEMFEERVNALFKTEVSLSSLCVQYYDFLFAKYFILADFQFRIFACFGNSKNELLYYKKSVSEKFKVCFVNTKCFS
jgi:hypothetical protein